MKYNNTVPTWEKLKKYALLMCSDDVYFMTNLVYLVWEHNNYQQDIKRSKLQEDTLELIKELIDEKLIKVFRVSATEHSEIEDKSTDEIIEYIQNEWNRIDRNIPIENEVAWFEATEKGEIEASKITDFMPSSTKLT